MSEEPPEYGVESGERGSLAPDASFGSRLRAALWLEPSLYESVEADPRALGQAATVVALAGIANGIGALPTSGAGALIGGLAMSFVAWLMWAGVVWLIGVKLFEHSSNFEELLRTLGFAAAPQLLYVLGWIPVLGAVVALVVLVMTGIAIFRAMRAALDVDSGRALFLALLAVVAYALLRALLGLGAWRL
jgi:hypothetical protein